MARTNQHEIAVRILIENPVPGVPHSLQSKDGAPVDAKRSTSGEPLAFDFPIRVAEGPKFFGDQVRREGPVRRFVYIRIGRLAGDCSSPWSRRMKIDIHDLEPTLVEQAVAGDGVVEIAVDGTAKDGSPACATMRPVRRSLV
jgi:hypothetical protein